MHSKSSPLPQTAATEMHHPMPQTEPQETQSENSHVPDDIVLEILSRLPVKSVVRFKCVAKTWQSFICREQFIRSHLRNSTYNIGFPNHRVITYSMQSSAQLEIAPKQYYLQPMLNDLTINPTPMANFPAEDGWQGTIVGCCNGLVCILQSGHVFLWNPATRISKKLPILHNSKDQRQRHNVTRSGFGWDESSGAYKVFAMLSVYHPSDSTDYMIYNSKTNSWKTLEMEKAHSSFNLESWQTECLPNNTGKFVCGKLHWFEFFKHNIVSFDLKSEVFGIIEAPCKPRGMFKKLWLGEIGGCLCAVSDQVESSIDVWVMKDSWLKLATISFVHYPGLNPITPLFGDGPNGEILLLNGDTLFLYYPRDNDDYFSLAAQKFCGSYKQTHVYVESLVSPLFLHDNQF